MRKRTTLIALGVLVVIMATLGVRPYSGLTRSQRDKVVQRFILHVASYQASHDGHFPSTLHQLVASEPMEPDLVKLIQKGHVAYTPPKEPSEYGEWELRIDGEVSSIGPASD